MLSEGFNNVKSFFHGAGKLVHMKSLVKWEVTQTDLQDKQLQKNLESVCHVSACMFLIVCLGCL